MLAGTKAVPTGETPSLGRSQKQACHARHTKKASPLFGDARLYIKFKMPV